MESSAYSDMRAIKDMLLCGYLIDVFHPVLPLLVSTQGGDVSNRTVEFDVLVQVKARNVGLDVIDVCWEGHMIRSI
jgi:hypothetical protein